MGLVGRCEGGGVYVREASGGYIVVGVVGNVCKCGVLREVRVCRLG